MGGGGDKELEPCHHALSLGREGGPALPSTPSTTEQRPLTHAYIYIFHTRENLESLRVGSGDKWFFSLKRNTTISALFCIHTPISFNLLISHPKVGPRMSLLLTPWQLHMIKNEEQENGQVMFVKFLFLHQHYFAD